MEHKKRLGLALCGSYCTYEQVFRAAESLRETYDLVPIMSETAAATDTRFGTAEENLRRLEALTGKPAVHTLAKLALGLTDSAVAMAAKAHLRNGRPLVIAFSTNDGLSGSAENIARLLNRKHVYFVPFRQDDPEKKPRSLQADFSLLAQTVEAALRGEQLQPILR